MAITKKVKSGIEITESGENEDGFSCSSTQGEVHHVAEMRGTIKVSQMPRILTFFSKPIPRRTKSFPYGYILLHSEDSKLYNHFKTFTKEKSGSLHNLP
jgi:hypothetical protein